jgi:hypothetical protein
MKTAKAKPKKPKAARWPRAEKPKEKTKPKAPPIYPLHTWGIVG